MSFWDIYIESGLEHYGRHQCCGPTMFIPDPNFSIPDPGSRVKKNPDPGSGSASKNCSSQIPDLDFSHPGSSGQKSTGSWILDPGSATLDVIPGSNIFLKAGDTSCSTNLGVDLNTPTDDPPVPVGRRGAPGTTACSETWRGRLPSVPHPRTQTHH